MSEDALGAGTITTRGGTGFDAQDGTDGFLSYLAGNGIGYGETLLSCQGADPEFSRIGGLAALLLSHERDGVPSVSDVVVLVAPGSTAEDVRLQLMRGMDATLTARRGSGLQAEEHQAVAKRLSVRVARDLLPASMLEAIDLAGTGTAVIAVDAAMYRSSDILPFVADGAVGPILPEDSWAPQLAETARLATGAARRAGCFVIIDAGTMTPHRPQLRAMLEAIDDALGAIFARLEDDPMEFVAAHADRWIGLLEVGRLGAVFREIDAAPMSETDKLLVRAQSLHRAGLFGHAVEAVDKLLRFPERPAARTAIALAKIAADAGAFPLCTRLLSPAVEGDLAREELEMALDIAEGVEGDELADRVAAKLLALYGDSPRVWRRRLAALVETKDFETAARELEARDASEGDVQYYRILADALKVDGIPDYTSVLARTSRLGSEHREAGRIACVQDAIARRLPWHARDLAPQIVATQNSIAIALEILENTFFERKDGKLVASYEDVQADLIKIVGCLSERPLDFPNHAKLSRVLSGEVAGRLGLALVASVVFELAKRPIDLVKEERPSTVDLGWLDEHSDLFEPIAAWMQAEAPTVMGRANLPRELVNCSPDDMMAALVDCLQTQALSIADDIDELVFLASAAVAVAPHTSNPDRDIEVMRFLACRLVASGRVQLARDICHQIFLNAGGGKARARAAWFASADIHHRTGNLPEATLAMACAMSIDEPFDERRVWLETVLLVRILRDAGLEKHALSALATVKSVFAKFAFAKANLHRLDVLELQIRQSALNDEPDVGVAATELLAKAIAVGKHVEAINDTDVGPLAVLIGELSRKAAALGLAIPHETSGLLTRLADRGGETIAALIRAVNSTHPTIADVVAQATMLESPRYSGDAGFGARSSVLLAGRFLSSEAALADPEAAVYAIECLADGGTAVPGWVTAAAPARIARSPREAAETAQALSRSGVAIVLLGLDEGGRLISLAAIDGVLSAPSRGRKDAITSTLVEDWGRNLPYDYGLEEETSNLFLTSTERFVLDILADRPAIIVADTRLQAFPPNLFRRGDAFAGSRVPLAAAPSLAWLAAAHRAKAARDGRELAWIATTDGEIGTLAVVAGWLGNGLGSQSMELTTSNTVPVGFANADLAVVVAHGQTISDNDFFQAIANDALWKVAADSFANALQNIGVCILFVCSGGRIDRHPSSNTTLGLAKALLNRGCSAVVASPWPIDPRITVRWLPTFYEAWHAGKRVIEANFLANVAVAEAYPHDRAKALAMTVYGDALMTRRGEASLSNAPSSTL